MPIIPAPGCKRIRIQSLPQLHKEFKVNLSYLRPCLKQTTTKTKVVCWWGLWRCSLLLDTSEKQCEADLWRENLRLCREIAIESIGLATSLDRTLIWDASVPRIRAKKGMSRYTIHFWFLPYHTNRSLPPGFRIQTWHWPQVLLYSVSLMNFSNLKQYNSGNYPRRPCMQSANPEVSRHAIETLRAQRISCWMVFRLSALSTPSLGGMHAPFL